MTKLTSLDIINPFNEEVIAQSNLATPEDVNQAVLKAHRALPAWQALEPSARQNF